jgi:hypothetical protein
MRELQRPDPLPAPTSGVRRSGDYPAGRPPYETTDIWVDSERNGWDTYRYHDASGRPVGQGDDAWVNHDNRVYVQIRNLGTHVATDIRVQVYVNSPPGLGDAGSSWDFVGTIIFPTVPAGGAPVSDYVLWRPTVGAHTCIRAVIAPIPGEASGSNNTAQENIAAFDTTPGSPWRPITLEARVFNPSRRRKTPVVFGLRDIPKGWAVKLEPPELVVPRGGEGLVRLTVYPSGAPRGQEDKRLKQQNRPGFVGKPKLEAYAPYGDTWAPIGGIDVWTHLVNETKLTARGSAAKGLAIVTGRISPPVSGAIIAVEFKRGHKANRPPRQAEEGRDLLSPAEVGRAAPIHIPVVVCWGHAARLCRDEEAAS